MLTIVYCMLQRANTQITWETVFSLGNTSCHVLLIVWLYTFFVSESNNLKYLLFWILNPALIWIKKFFKNRKLNLNVEYSLCLPNIMSLLGWNYIFQHQFGQIWSNLWKIYPKKLVTGVTPLYQHVDTFALFWRWGNPKDVCVFPEIHRKVN